MVTDPDILRRHRFDHATFWPRRFPRALVRPSSTEQVQQVVLAAREHRVPVDTQGARTGLSGGANAVDGCLLLSTEHMCKILEIDVATTSPSGSPAW